jgi:ATP-binding cassette subfamily E protein 1
MTLAKPADVYLIDEPSAFLDAEQRVRAARAMKFYLKENKKSAFIVEHDFIMATYLADE